MAHECGTKQSQKNFTVGNLADIVPAAWFLLVPVCQQLQSPMKDTKRGWSQNGGNWDIGVLELQNVTTQHNITH